MCRIFLRRMFAEHVEFLLAMSKTSERRVKSKPDSSVHKKIKAVIEYKKIGWKTIPLKGKRPYHDG